MRASFVLTGGSGFLGGHLLKQLSENRVPVRAFSRTREGVDPQGVVWIRRDLQKDGVSPSDLAGGDLVVNLAFDRSAPAGANARAAANLARAAWSAGVRRLIHVSTAEVAGRRRGWIDERMTSRPATRYQREKLEIEAVLEEVSTGLDLIILRPTLVFGPGGRNLVRIAEDIRAQRWLRHAARLLAYGRRPVHLVPVSEVVDAIWFVAGLPPYASPRRFFVSADDEPGNNYLDVARELRYVFHGRRETMLEDLLASVGRVSSILNPRVGQRYSSQSLMRAGFDRRYPLIEAVRAFAVAFPGQPVTDR